MQSTIYDANLGSSLKLRQILDGGWQLSHQVVIGRTTAGIDPSEIYAGRGEPVASLSTADLTTVLTNVDPADGLLISDGLTLPFQKRASGATYASGSNHWASTATKALVIVTEISAARDQEGEDQPGATAQLEAHVESSDGSDPVSGSSGQALAATAFVDQYSMGPVVINGTTLTDPTGFRVRPGIEVHKVWSAGLDFPTLVCIRRRTPVIEIDVEHLDSLATSGGFGLGASALTSASVYLKRKDDGARYESDVSLLHGKISFATGLTKIEAVQGSGSDDASATIMLHGKALSWSAANALP